MLPRRLRMRAPSPMRRPPLRLSPLVALASVLVACHERARLDADVPGLAIGLATGDVPDAGEDARLPEWAPLPQVPPPMETSAALTPPTDVPAIALAITLAPPTDVPAIALAPLPEPPDAATPADAASQIAEVTARPDVVVRDVVAPPLPVAVAPPPPPVAVAPPPPPPPPPPVAAPQIAIPHRTQEGTDAHASRHDDRAQRLARAEVASHHDQHAPVPSTPSRAPTPAAQLPPAPTRANASRPHHEHHHPSHHEDPRERPAAAEPTALRPPAPRPPPSTRPRSPASRSPRSSTRSATSRSTTRT